MPVLGFLAAALALFLFCCFFRLPILWWTLLFAPLGAWAMLSALINSFVADVLTGEGSEAARLPLSLFIP